MRSLAPVSLPKIFNVTLTTTGVEYSQVVQDGSTELVNIRSLQIRSKEDASMQYGFITTGPYVTIPKGCTYWQDNIDMPNLTVYLVGSVDGQTAEIQVWQ